MNLGPLFTWATMVLYHLNNPASEARQAISADRMEQKLGWLRDYAHDLVLWNPCQEVIDRSLSVINLHGLDAQTSPLVEHSLTEHNPNWRQQDCSSTRIAEQLLDSIQLSFGKLESGERAWLSTEILESLFGKFKQIERQHSKGGFTRLIAAIPTLCMHATRETVRKAFDASAPRRRKRGLKRISVRHSPHAATQPAKSRAPKNATTYFLLLNTVSSGQPHPLC